ncbi:ester cyclase [Paractinoplanes durhamensis]|uniref:ester cyclase n=1 Tax=Paractinoplanes durhamensis TaxID=113563 RepID=UPI00364047DD
MSETFGVRYIKALAAADHDTLDELYADDVVFYTPFRRGVTGPAFIQAFIAAFHQAHPGLTVTLHDEFADAGGDRVALRFSIRWHNTGPFLGLPPTGAQGWRARSTRSACAPAGSSSSGSATTRSPSPASS